MIPADQSTFGPFGNCFAACIASLLEVPAETVPNFMLGLPSWDPNDSEAAGRWARAFLAAVNAWLAPRGLWYFELWVDGGLPRYLTDATPTSAYWLGVGPVEGGAYHAVVMRGAEMVHDPHPRRTGLERVEIIGLLVPFDPAKAEREAEDAALEWREHREH